MPAILDMAEGWNIALYDSDTSRSLPTLWAVDVSDRCPSGERTVMLFAVAKRGPIVQIVWPYDGLTYGSATHFFVDEMDLAENADLLSHRAKRLGLSLGALIDLVDDVKPSIAEMATA